MKQKLLNKSLAIGDTLEVGIPFGKTYYKRTPKIMRNIGDGLLAASLICSTLAAVFVFPPTIIAITSCIGIAGKYITNCFAEKD